MQSIHLEWLKLRRILLLMRLHAVNGCIMDPSGHKLLLCFQASGNEDFLLNFH
ncbi:hypothetical protein OIU79_017727 [Salix purpurea]|uniref:Uncharacterized protein n=1 Tax=Salix purpurea TaxID=77065 RepID=A0A9Q0WVN7_SALPP|nr:hypothetical protein OIU79_017727 [Salix purpurea]